MLRLNVLELRLHNGFPFLYASSLGWAQDYVIFTVHYVPPDGIDIDDDSIHMHRFHLAAGVCDSATTWYIYCY